MECCCRENRRHLRAPFAWTPILKSPICRGHKFVVAIALTPLLYVAHYIIDRYLGQEVADRMADEAGEDLSIF